MQNRLSIRQKYSRCNPEADIELYQSANFLLLPEAFVFVACLTFRAPFHGTQIPDIFSVNAECPKIWIHKQYLEYVYVCHRGFAPSDYRDKGQCPVFNVFWKLPVSYNLCISSCRRLKS